MAADPLTPAVSDRICRHMNDDHRSAVAAYARHYGGCPQGSAARLKLGQMGVHPIPVDIG